MQRLPGPDADAWETARMSPTHVPAGSGLSVAGLFAGVDGIELGLQRAGHHAALLCESWQPAAAVLGKRFPGVAVVGDVRELAGLPEVDVVAAGFPCTDLSQAGRTAGITGAESSLVGEVFRLLRRTRPTWLLLENVRNMLSLDRGRAMRYLTDELAAHGYRWAYRVVDSRFAGVAQRRHRMLLLASPTADPRAVLFADDAGEPPPERYRDHAYGFYWTEGLRGAPLAGLRRRADLVLPRAKVAVFVDGCFWHRCPDHATVPASNTDWWQAKLDANVARDRDTDRRLADAGWAVVRVWEHEDPEHAADRVAAAVGQRR